MMRLALLLMLGIAAPLTAAERPPNVVLIFADDLGYGDLGCYGATGWATPHLDRMAKEGVRFTDFHTAQPVCSASRAALLTGCYANRIGIHGALGPQARHGIADGELTLAELCKQKGYATGMVGKWHLGHHPRFLPTRHGFDSYLGLPYSNDMWPHHPEAQAAGRLPQLAARRERQGHRPGRDRRGPGDADAAVHRPGGEVHRGEQSEAVLPVLRAQLPARPTVRRGKVQGFLEAGALRRRDPGDRRVGRRGSDGAEGTRPGARHAGDVHQRQRPVAELRQPRRRGRPAARGEGDGVGGRRPRAVRRPLAGSDPRRTRCRPNPP